MAKKSKKKHAGKKTERKDAVKKKVEKLEENKEDLDEEKVGVEQEEELDKEKAEEKKISKKKIRRTENRQVMWAIFLMLAIILIIFLVPYVTKNYVNKFVYNELNFQKTKLGKLKFYSTKIPVTDSNLKIIGTYSMNFRSDPRDEYIDVPNNSITFNKNKAVYVSLDPEMEACPDNMLALMNFGSFLRDFGGLNIKSSVTDKQYAKDNNATYASCEQTKPNTIIEIRSGDKTEIKKIKDNCYEMTYTNCEIIPVTERFMLLILKEYMKFFVRK